MAVDLDALIERLQKLGRDMDRHAHPDWDEHEDVFAAVNAITALRRAPVSAGKVKAIAEAAIRDCEAGAPISAANLARDVLAALQPGDGWQGITRVDLIDHSEGGQGVAFTKRGISVSLDVQDDGRTLKVFVAPPSALS